MKFVKTAVLAIGMMSLAYGTASAQAQAPRPPRPRSRPRSRPAAIGVALVILGAAMGIGGLTKSAVESSASQPETAANIQKAMIISAALIEGVTFFALIIILLQTLNRAGHAAQAGRMPPAVPDGPPGRPAVPRRGIARARPREVASMPRQEVLALGLVAALALAPAPTARSQPTNQAEGHAASSPQPEGPRRARSRGHRSEAQHLGAGTLAGHLDGGRLPRAPLGARQVGLGALVEGLASARGAHGARPARRRTGPQRERTPAGRAPQADGGHGRRGASPDRRGATRRPGGRATRSSARRRPKPRPRGIAPARDRPRPRPALVEISSKTADLAVSVAGRVLSRELTESDHRRLIETAMGELPASPAANGAGRRDV